MHKKHINVKSDDFFWSSARLHNGFSICRLPLPYHQTASVSIVDHSSSAQLSSLSRTKGCCAACPIPEYLSSRWKQQ
jgi:hypothetical protein